MQKEMPIGGYKWFTEITLSEILSTPADSAFRYFVEVDLAYPAKVHDVHNHLPLAPEKMKVPIEWRSDYTNPFNLNVGSSTKELVETLHDKAHYVCHKKTEKCVPSMS